MPRLFIEDAEHTEFILKAIEDKPSVALISSFGVFGGILHDSRDSTTFKDSKENNSRKILDALGEIQSVYMMIGLTTYASCSGNYCIDCEKKFVKNLLRVYAHAEFFNKLSWRMTSELHLKCYLFFYADGSKRGISGGRNLTGSNWDDLSLELDDDNIDKISNYYTKLYKKAMPVNNGSVERVLEQNNISSKSVQLMLNE